MKLLIAIPALNEEESIEAMIERSLAARDKIIARSPVTGVDITVVSDGSTDRTASLARKYTDTINLIVFEQNQGYGAAIQQAWLRLTPIFSDSSMQTELVSPSFLEISLELSSKKVRTLLSAAD